MGRPTTINRPPGIEAAPVQVPPHFHGSFQALPETGNAASLCMKWPFEALVYRGDGRAFHIIHLLCTGFFALPVGVVGNQGGLPEVADRFSNPPELHRRILENSASPQIAVLQTLPTDFHFSCLNY
jgi:hypothetical protein